jgi:hypothetical protein
MQKISSYLYPNRIQLLTNLDDESNNDQVEWRIVYQRTIKIYKGIDNVLEVDVKNNDQKRISLLGKQIYMVIFDQANNEINRYLANNLEDDSSQTSKGLARITIMSTDLENLIPQSFSFVVYMHNEDATLEILYGDSKYGARGTIDLLNGVNHKPRLNKRYDNFKQETNYQTSQTRSVSYYSDPMPVRFYEAVPTTIVKVTAHVTGFVGTIGIQTTQNETFSHEAFMKEPVQTQIFTQARNTPVVFDNIDVSQLTYIRLKFTSNTGATDIIGKVDYAILSV